MGEWNEGGVGGVKGRDGLPRRVVLPLPDGPIKAVIRPGYNTPETFFNRLIFSLRLAWFFTM